MIQDARQQQRQQQQQQQQQLQPPPQQHRRYDSDSGNSSNYDINREKEEVLKMFTEAWDRFMSKGGGAGGSQRRRNRVADVQQGAPVQSLHNSRGQFSCRPVATSLYLVRTFSFSKCLLINLLPQLDTLQVKKICNMTCWQLARPCSHWTTSAAAATATAAAVSAAT